MWGNKRKGQKLWISFSFPFSQHLPKPSGNKKRWQKRHTAERRKKVLLKTTRRRTTSLVALLFLAKNFPIFWYFHINIILYIWECPPFVSMCHMLQLFVLGGQAGGILGAFRVNLLYTYFLAIHVCVNYRPTKALVKIFPKCLFVTLSRIVCVACLFY